MEPNDQSQVEILELKVEVWKKIVDVQMHFNELEMKVRNFAILILSAFLGGAGLALKEDVLVTSHDIPLAALLCFACVGICVVFYFVDQVWYHPLLKGAVLQGMAAEKSLQSQLPDIGLTHKIGESSAYPIWGDAVRLRSRHKIQVLYFSLGGLFALLGVALMFSHSPNRLATPSQPALSERKVPEQRDDLLVVHAADGSVVVRSKD